MPQTDKSCMGVNHDQGIGRCRRVYGLCDQHESEGRHHREYVYPKGIPEPLKTKNADKGAPQVATEQRPRLGCRRTGEAEKENRRTAKRGEQKGRSRQVDKP